MRQRLGIAVALLTNPPLIFLDEPTSALDPVGGREIRTLLLRLRQEGATVSLNSHLLGEAEMVCDQVGILRDGHLVAAGPLAELLRTDPREAEVTVRADDTAARTALQGRQQPDCLSSNICRCDIMTL